MPGRLTAYELHGYAIVSDDGMIADAAGVLPEPLKNEADWTYFQAELDLARLVLLGRRSHEAAPNPRGRKRMVASRSVATLERRSDGWWWNPTSVPLSTALEEVVPGGGRIAVPGGQALFDLLINERRFDRFHLSHAVGVRLPGGLPLFSAAKSGTAVDSVLAAAGLAAGPTITLDPRAPVTLTVWRRAHQPPQLAADGKG